MTHGKENGKEKQCCLRRQNPRFITGHQQGKGTIVNYEPSPALNRDSFSIFPLYSIQNAPEILDGNQDLHSFVQNVEKEPPLAGKKDQPLIQFVEGNLDPLSSTEMHRSISIDFVTVTQGAVILELEDGTERMLLVGESVVQRGTLHRWRNPSETQAARFVGITISCHEFSIDGQVVEPEGW